MTPIKTLIHLFVIVYVLMIVSPIHTSGQSAGLRSTNPVNGMSEEDMLRLRIAYAVSYKSKFRLKFLLEMVRQTTTTSYTGTIATIC